LPEPKKDNQTNTKEHWNMPRPKPPAPLKVRYVRLSDKQWIIFKQLGGLEWLRETLDKKAPMPKQYYDVLLQEKLND
jgi:hypothetical protein